MPLSADQISEMTTQIREESEAGRPEIAAQYRGAMARGEWFEPPTTKPKPVLGIPNEYGPGSKKDEWAEFAKANSDLDEEVIDSVTKTDLIMMLKATGVIPMTDTEVE